MNFENLPVGTLVYCCKVCDLYFVDPNEVTVHLNDHTFANEEEATNSIVMLTVDHNNESLPETSLLCEESAEQKLWSKAAIILLIELVEEYDEKFQNSVKKHIWLKISKRINDKLKTQLTWLQCDTKWKSLNKTYKDIRCHNNTSGKDRKKWEYYDIMNRILYKKPEIIPPATCSSNEGLKINETVTLARALANETSSQASHLPIQPSTSGLKTVESTMAKKRKVHASDVERRHKEKMARQDGFLKQFEELISILKTSKGTMENENVPEN